MSTNYNVRMLLDMAEDWLAAENDFHIFLLTFKGGWVPNLDPSEYGRYVQKETECVQKWSALNTTCDIVSANAPAVVAAAKAMQRRDKKERWQTCIHFSRAMEENARRFFSI